MASRFSRCPSVATSPSCTSSSAAPNSARILLSARRCAAFSSSGVGISRDWLKRKPGQNSHFRYKLGFNCATPSPRPLCQVVGEKILPAPFQQNNLLADVLLQSADQIELGEYLFSELPKFGPTFGRQQAKSRIDPVLESRRNTLAVFTHRRRPPR